MCTQIRIPSFVVVSLFSVASFTLFAILPSLQAFVPIGLPFSLSLTFASQCLCLSLYAETHRHAFVHPLSHPVSFLRIVPFPPLCSLLVCLLQRTSRLALEHCEGSWKLQLRREARSSLARHMMQPFRSLPSRRAPLKSARSKLRPDV